MLKVGITGGIGSGKTIVCQVFKTLGIPVFNADMAAREVMEKDVVLVESIQQLLGPDVYRNDKLQRDKVSSIVFAEPQKLAQLNALVHPATIAYGKKWIASQTTPYVIKEAAIFFESGSYTDMDIMVGVYAPKELRVVRALSREGMTEEKIRARMANQMDEDEKMKRCNHVITNDDTTAIIPQVISLHKILLEKANR